MTSAWQAKCRVFRLIFSWIIDGLTGLSIDWSFGLYGKPKAQRIKNLVYRSIIQLMINWDYQLIVLDFQLIVQVLLKNQSLSVENPGLLATVLAYQSINLILK